MMTPKEIFNTVVKHLMTQKKQSYLSGVGCAYRGRDNTKCAVGVLIKDEHYSPAIEGKRAAADSVVKALHDSGIDAPIGGMLSDMLMRLQGIHDSGDYATQDWDSVKNKIRWTAKDYECYGVTLNESLFNK